MAKKAYDGSIDYRRRDIDWGVGDASTENLPLSGKTVQQYIKDNFDHKAGYFETRNDKGKCYIFASSEDASIYWTDTSTYAELLLGEFSVENDYMLTIDVVNPAYGYKTLFTNNKDAQKLIFNWDVVHKSSSASQDEAVKCTYTIIREGYTNSYSVFYSAVQKHVETDITEYLKSNGEYVEGETYINIAVEGQTHQVSSSATITYKVVNFSFHDNGYDVSKIYSSTNSNNNILSINWTATGAGSKTLYKFLDGVKLSEKSIGNTDISGTEDFNLTGLSVAEGRHNIIMYVSITFDNTVYYFSDVLCRDFMVYNGTSTTPMVATMVDVPISYLPNIKTTDTVRSDCYPLRIYDAEQYVQYDLSIGAFDPSTSAKTDVNIILNNKALSTVSIEKDKVVNYTIVPEDYGTQTLKFNIRGITYDVSINIAKSSMELDELHPESIEFFFSAEGKTNDSPDRAEWSYVNPLIPGSKTYTASFNGKWNWNNSSGWVNNGLLIGSDSSISFDYKPLGNTQNGKTIEFEIETRNVSNDSTVICDLAASSGNTRFTINANSASLTSAGNATVTTKFKSEERTRISFVINTPTSENKSLTFIYVNGILSGGVYYANSSYTISKELTLYGSNTAQIWVKQIRVYNIALSSDEILNNYIKYRDTGAEMKSIYDKNNIINNGAITKDLLLKNLKLPVMTVIGEKENMPALKWLDLKAGKTDQVDVNILYENPWDPNTSFYAEHITMTPQGTSSMVYPKRNYRIYTAYDKLLEPDSFKMWYTYGYPAEQKDKWKEIKVSGEKTSSEDKRKRKYIFKEGSQKAVRWTIKADFAESSGTHNTGIARLWNKAMRNASITYDQSPTYYEKVQVGTEYHYEMTTYNAIMSKPEVTESMITTVEDIPIYITSESPVYIKIIGKKSIANSRATETRAQYCARTYEYEDASSFEAKEGEVRTCVDGYPIAMFYQRSENDQLVFMGKYNFNNDKSSKSIFGFEDIPSFDEGKNGYWKPGTGHGFLEKCDSSTDPNAEKYSESMQCWELTNSGDSIALFTQKPAGSHSTDFRSGFEARFPSDDGEDTEITRFEKYVKPFADWLVDIKDDASTIIVREHPGQPATVTLAEYKSVTREEYESKVERKDELEDISFWADPIQIAAKSYQLVSEELTQEDVNNFPNINKVIRYKNIKTGSDVITVQFVKKNEIYEQLVKTTSNKIISWTNTPRFKEEKWEHFDIFKIAAYYIYLIRFGAVDQTVKNAMFTSEDGRHWYYINYDNDTVLGVRNDGRLIYDPTITRQTWDDGISDYAYAGYESTLWNCLENDDEFMNEVVPAVDDALFKSGLSYSDTTKEMNTNQCKKWCEKIYNKDAQYKYVDSYLQDKQNYLYSMQGSRESHRNWWLSKRFNFYDAKFANTSYTGNDKSIDFIAPGVVESDSFKITAGATSYYSIGVNNRMVRKQDEYDLPILLNDGSTFNFKCPGWTLQVGSPVNIYSSPNIKKLDFSVDSNAYGSKIARINFTGANSSTQGTMLEELILNGNSDNTSYEDGNAVLGLSALTKLKYLDVKNIKGVNNNFTTLPDVKTLSNLETFISTGSCIEEIEFAQGCPISVAKLSHKTVKLVLNDLPNLAWGNNGLLIGSGVNNDMSNLATISIKKCPKLSNDFNKIYNWFKVRKNNNLLGSSSLTIHDISWKNVSYSQLVELGDLRSNGGEWDLLGKIVTEKLTSIDQVKALKDIYGQNVFESTNGLYITDNESIFIVGPTTIISGNIAEYSAVRLTGTPINNPWSMDIPEDRDDISLDPATGTITTWELGYPDISLNLRYTYLNNAGLSKYVETPITFKKPTYPTKDDLQIVGLDYVTDDTATYTLSSAVPYTGHLHIEWQADFEGYISIEGESRDKLTITLKSNGGFETIVNGTLTATVTQSDEYSTEIGDITKNIKFINTDVLVIEESNPTLFYAMKDLGWLRENDNSYYLKSQAHEINDASLVSLLDKIKNGSKDGTPYYKSLTKFNELKEFTKVENFPTYAFSRNNSKEPYGLEEIILPPNLVNLAAYSFHYCDKLKNIVIPKYVKNLYNNSLEYCTNLEDIKFEEDSELLNIYNYAFRGNSNITSLKFPDKFKGFRGGNVCANMSKLNYIRFSAAFEYFSSTDTGSTFNDFNSTKKLNKIEVDSNNIKYTSQDENGNECNAVIEKSTNTIVLGSCSTTFPSNVTTIGRRSFYDRDFNGGKDGIFNIPDNIKNIEEYAFYNTPIKKIVISNDSQLAEIKNEVFSSCSQLTSISFRSSITNVDEHAFYFSNSLNEFDIQNNDKYCSEYTIGDKKWTNILYDYQNFILHRAKVDDFTGYTFPDDMKRIGYGAFNWSNAKVNTIDLSNTRVETIAGRAFSTMQNQVDLGKLIFPSTLTNIDSYAFVGWKKLHEIVITTPFKDVKPPITIQQTTWGTGADTAGFYSSSNKLYVPTGTGELYTNSSISPNSYLWTNNLLNPSYGKFTVVEESI